MKLETLISNKEKYEAELRSLRYGYDNVNAPKTVMLMHTLEWKIAGLKSRIAEKLKDSDEYKHYQLLKQKYAEYNLS